MHKWVKIQAIIDQSFLAWDLRACRGASSGVESNCRNIQLILSHDDACRDPASFEDSACKVHKPKTYERKEESPKAHPNGYLGHPKFECRQDAPDNSMPGTDCKRWSSE